MKTIKKILRKMRSIIIRLFRFFRNDVLYVYCYLRYYFFHKRKRKYLLQYKDKYYGKRVFIVATGPSLTLDDLELIKNEYSISFNGIVKMFNRSSFRPTFYMIQDGVALNDLFQEINDSNINEVFCGIGNRYNLPHNLDDKMVSLLKNKKIIKYYLDSIKYFRVCGIYNFAKPYKRTRSFTKDFSVDVGENGSVVFSAIQFAIYLGFKEIYLLGTDCTNSHFYEGTSKLVPNKFLLQSWAFVKDYIKNTDIKLYNCTKGGVLECFDRVELEKIISK